MGIGLLGGIDKRFIEGQNLYGYLQSANFISFWPTLVYSVQCTVYSIQRTTLYSYIVQRKVEVSAVQCIVQSVQAKFVNGTQSTGPSVPLIPKCTVNRTYCTVHSVQSAVNSICCTMYNVQ